MSEHELYRYLNLALYYSVMFGIGYGLAYLYIRKSWAYKIIGSIAILFILAQFHFIIYYIDKPTVLTGFLFFNRKIIVYYLTNIILFLFSIINIFNLPFTFKRKDSDNTHYNNTENESETETERERRYREYQESMNGKGKKEDRQEKHEEKHEEEFFKNQDPYKVFDLPYTATRKEIDQRYLLLVKLYHPDKFTQVGDAHRKQNEEIMKIINRAYGQLKQKV